MGMFSFVNSVFPGVGSALDSTGDLFKKPQAPATPDYTAAANAQGQQNRDTARYNAQLSNPWFSNPYGTQTVDWSGAKTGSTDTPYVSTQLNELGQKTFDQQQQLSSDFADMTQGSLQNVRNAYSQPFSFGNGDELQAAAEDAIMSRVNPQLQRTEDTLRTRLATSGITPGSEAWNYDMDQQGRNANDARTQAILSAIQIRPQILGEETALRNQPLNELNALRTGAQVNVPQFQGFSGAQAAAAPIYQATQQQGQDALSQYNADMAWKSGMLGGLFSLGGKAAAAGFGGAKPV